MMCVVCRKQTKTIHNNVLRWKRNLRCWVWLLQKNIEQYIVNHKIKNHPKHPREKK